MAAVRARRHARGGAPESGRRRGRPAPSAHEALPRLATIKLSGGLAGEGGVQVSPKSLAFGLMGVVLFSGAAIAGAAWMGASLFDVREAFSRSADGAAAQAGFAVRDLEVVGVAGARAEEVRALIVPEGRRSLLSLAPLEVKARVESLDWVEAAHVRRLWPSRLRVEVSRRRAYARWREDGEIAVIDANGRRLLAERAAEHPELPLVVGRGAGPAAQPLLIALEELPALRTRLRALVRVNDRRWNVELRTGATIALPEAHPVVALSRLEGLQARHALLDRPLAFVDMRAEGRLAVRVRPELAGAVHAAPLAGA